MLCNSPEQCDLGDLCTAGICLPCEVEPCRPPVILSVDGTGLPDGALGHAKHYAQKERITLQGLNLTDTSVTLNGPNVDTAR